MIDAKTAKKLLSKLKPDYADFFQPYVRSSSKKNKPVMIVKNIDQFLLKLVADETIPEIDRVLISIILSGACRITEALTLSRADVERTESGDLYFSTKVLKKRGKIIKRPILIHAAAVPLVSKHLISLRGFEKLFKFSSDAALYRVRKAIALDTKDAEGLDCHSFRHSFVTFMLHTKDLSIAKVSGIMKLDSRQVMRYAHVDAKKELKALYKQEGEAS